MGSKEIKGILVGGGELIDLQCQNGDAIMGSDTRTLESVMSHSLLRIGS